MSIEQEGIRTFGIDEYILRDLASDNRALEFEAAIQLPEALNRAEVSAVALQVGLLPVANQLREGERLEKRALFVIGSVALSERIDLVTAESAAEELRLRSDFAGYITISHKLRGLKESDIRSILEG